MKKYAIGLDIGGSHVTGCIINLETKKIVEQSSYTGEVDSHENRIAIFKVWADVIQTLANKVPANELAGVAFAMPGPFDYVNGIGLFKGNDKFEDLYNVNVSSSLQEILGLNLDFRFINDATAFAVGETWSGSVAGINNVIGITLGTGFGSAFMEDGIPVIDDTRVPENGCLWYLPYKNGIADDYFSTRWFTKSYESMTGEELKGVKQISERVATDAVAKLLFEEFGNNLGAFMAKWVKNFSAKAIVIGGNQVKGYDLFGPSMESALLKEGTSPAIHLSVLMEDAALLGAARLFEDDFYKKIFPLLSKM